ncbi:hypothetical protein ADL01_18320 [Streptomyces sp. NRRL WC-3618]|uniref:DUF5134 domain-containing protein n=1 Tax=Streptomyces sp. NRRL WC-3618 TaxID=1519490 RepID=UPI0006ADD116|nr:DUF5134 domain-containing protein [Streptomyces sp. NRRL WC-3618]KOV73993.1 hypothetical protein ADL01_18320 [Streptomyces sp. NRRL WC-3618]
MSPWVAGLSALGAFCSVAAHPRRPLRTHLPHLVMAGAMLAMTAPRADPLGPLGWTLVFLLLAGTTLHSVVRGPLGFPSQLRAVNDVTGMACLVMTMLMPHEYGGTGHPAPDMAAMADLHHGSRLPWLLIALWTTGRLLLLVRQMSRTVSADRRRPFRFLAYAGELAMVASMGLMTA